MNRDKFLQRISAANLEGSTTAEQARTGHREFGRTPGGPVPWGAFWPQDHRATRLRNRPLIRTYTEKSRQRRSMVRDPLVSSILIAPRGAGAQQPVDTGMDGADAVRHRHTL